VAKIPFAYKRASRPFLGKTRCPVYEQDGQAICGFNRQWRFSPPRALDSFRRRAQHRLYTNNPAAGDMMHGRRPTAMPSLPL
jgi:hypothetical protein